MRWSAMLMLSTVFAPRFTPAVARSRRTGAGSIAWSGVCASDARGAGRVSERLLALLNGGAVPEVKSAVIANAQSKVLIVEFHQPIAARVLEEAQKRGALPYPVGAESKYEIPPLFYRLSGTFRQANPQSEHCAIRINPNRSGEETVLRILRESIASI